MRQSLIASAITFSISLVFCEKNLRGFIVACLVSLASFVIVSTTQNSLLYKLFIISVPRRIFSMIFSYFCALEIPFKPVRSLVYGILCRYLHVIQSEIIHPLDSYASIRKFLGREIDLKRRGLVEISNVFQHPGPSYNSIYSPSDSYLLHIGELSQQSVDRLTIKGIQFSITEILGSRPQLNLSSVYYALVFQLQANQYQGFVAPVNFEAQTYTHIHGDRMPMDSSFMAKTRGLVAKNERISIIGQWNERFIAVIPVTGLFTGGIVLQKLVDEGIKKFQSLKRSDYYVCGEKIGQFETGSCIVVILEIPNEFELLGIKTGAVQLGEEVARVSKKMQQ